MYMVKDSCFGRVQRLMLLGLLFIVLGLPDAMGSSSAHRPADTIRPGLRILSWNIYMLPKFAKITGKRQRAHCIVDQLAQSEIDIVVFQEAFLGDARRIIRQGLLADFPYAYGPANRKFSIKTNSGIWVLSKMPLEMLEEIDYVECEGFDDCFARKGALMLAGEFEGRPFQILGTHLQAGGPQSVRHSQYLEMAQMLDRHRKDNVPQFIVGDMNTGDTDTADYQDMLQCLQAEDAPPHINLPLVDGGYRNDLHARGVRSTRIIDYIFVRRNGNQVLHCSRKMGAMRQAWSKKHQDLSDHFYVLAECDW